MGKFFDTLRQTEAPRSPVGPAADAAKLLREPGEIRWEGAIFERVTSIERQLAALEEGLGKGVPEVEERLLHLLEGRLAALEGELHQATSRIASELTLESDRRRGDQRRLLLALAALGALVLAF
jgi:hypothetical protein